MLKFAANSQERLCSVRTNNSALGTASQEVIMAMRGVGKATRQTYKAGELEFVSKCSSEVNTIVSTKIPPSPPPQTT